MLLGVQKPRDEVEYVPGRRSRFGRQKIDDKVYELFGMVASFYTLTCSSSSSSFPSSLRLLASRLAFTLRLVVSSLHPLTSHFLTSLILLTFYSRLIPLLP